MAKLDTTDHRLLHLLQHNAKVTNAYLAQKTGLSMTAVFKRVRKLESNGFIKYYYAHVDQEKAGLGTPFFVQISLSSNSRESTETFLARIGELDEVVECHHTTGLSDFLLKIATRDLHSFQELITGEISKFDNIGRLNSIIVLSVMKDSRMVPIPMN